MTSTPNKLLKDPLFQLNAILWLSQPLPDTYEITPLLYEQGFIVYAIDPLLALPPGLRLVAQEAQVEMQGGVRPDVILEHEDDHKFAFVECKASSFSPASSTARQGRTLLVVAGSPAAEVLSLSAGQVSDSLLVFVTPDDDCGQMTQTLENLRNELNEKGLPTGRACTFGLSLTDSHIHIVIDGAASSFFTLSLGGHAFMKRDQDTDPRPLYFIPYQPSVQQSRTEAAFCRRVLFERMHSTIFAAVARALPPTDVVLESQKLLNDAMFGLYERWNNRDSETHMHRLCRRFMDSLTQAVNSVVADAIIAPSPRSWKISLQNEKQHEIVKDALGSFSCEKLGLEIEPERDLLDLMDSREDSSPVDDER